jgi:PIN domain nuclease of toxin-antitoxin system
MGSMIGRASAYLLDTHVILWWLFNDPRLSRSAFSLIRDPDNTIVVSSASGWEIATKHRLGKLPDAREAVERLPELLRISRMDVLPVSLEHALRAGSLARPPQGSI